MALEEAARFGRASVVIPASILAEALHSHREALRAAAWLHCGYSRVAAAPGIAPPQADLDLMVDNFFRLGPRYGFERTSTIVTTGLRASRFAPVLFWEVLHAVAPGGLWIDIDQSDRCRGTALNCEDFLSREYFRACLKVESVDDREGFRIHALRKACGTPLSAHIGQEGWSFGILTSAPSERAGEMAAAILALDLPRVEVIFCGPRPANAPKDSRVRVVDLDSPEPRGWITRKKNKVADLAIHDNLCLLHDRYVITPEWAAALSRYGPCYAFLTFPQAYYADQERRFSLRYPDYQVLAQSSGLIAALETHTYDAERVFHPAYDDFAETAFCCGGLYIARRCLWNFVRQDEQLYHCEWEDISFGLQCQRKGLPHRINPLLTAESTTAHPLLLTRLNELSAPDVRHRRRLHVTSGLIEAAGATPEIFKPVVTTTRRRYYRSVVDRFNTIPGLCVAERLTAEHVEGCLGLSDFWRAIEGRVAQLSLTEREQIAQVCFFLSDTVYKWPTCQLLSWIRDHEQAVTRPNPLADFSTIVGWGSGAAFKSLRPTLGRSLAYVIDSRRDTWGTRVDGLVIKAPAALGDARPDETAVVVFSCFADDITAAVRAIGKFPVFRAADLVARSRFRPLTDLVAHFEEVERYYPKLFAEADGA